MSAIASLKDLRGYWESAEAPFAAEEIEKIDNLLNNPPALTEEEWEVFFDRLNGPEGCDFKEVDGKTKWTCAGGNDKTLATKILIDMGINGREVERVLDLVDVLGGHCDCEILFNAEPRILGS